MLAGSICPICPSWFARATYMYTTLCAQVELRYTQNAKLSNSCQSNSQYPEDNFGTIVGENPDCLLSSRTVVGKNRDHVCWVVTTLWLSLSKLSTLSGSTTKKLSPRHYSTDNPMTTIAVFTHAGPLKLSLKVVIATTSRLIGLFKKTFSQVQP